MTDERLEMFVQRYQNNQTPWDTGITPPEIVQIVRDLPPGRALDIGCGTGTNVRYLLQHGWEADGIDFVQQAVDVANAKLAEFPPEKFRVLQYDATRLDECDGLRDAYDLVIDIGCGHGFQGAQQAKYARDVAARLVPGGTFMLYAHQTGAQQAFGWMPEDIASIFGGSFIVRWQDISRDTASGMPSAWYRLEKRPE